MKKIAVFTSGGDSPGMNAAIRAVVRGARHHGIEVYGIYRGYQGMINNDIIKMNPNDVCNIIQRGGTILKSARCMDFHEPAGRQKAYDNLKLHGIEGLVAIGGNGTFTGASIFLEEHGIPTVGVPGTIDNDIYGTDFTIGFDTAVNTAIDAIDKLRDTADSHDRAFFVEVMGRHAGFIALNSGIGGGAELVMIPEEKDTFEDVVATLKSGGNKDKSSSIIVVAEGEELGDVDTIASHVKDEIPEMKIRVTKLGHVQRGGSPSAIDRILGSRLGLAALESLVEGRKNVAVGVVNDEITFTNFHDAIYKKKDINKELVRMIKVLSV